MIIFGRRKIRIKKYDDDQIKCDHCKSHEERFFVYQEYFHLFFIPMFPSSIKMIESVCLKCNYSYNHEKRNHYLLITRTPIYMYAGTILILGLVASLVNENIRTQKENSEFVNNPKVNDVYLIREDHKKMTSYYFMKIKSMKADTLELLLGSQLYPRFVSTMQISDYFVTDKKYKILKSVLIKKYFDKGMINMVERNYDKSSRFMIEK